MKKRRTTATQKERIAIQRAIRRYEKKGVRFTDKLKQEIKQAGYQKLKSYHKNRFKRLLLSGSALSDSGETISGLQKRQELRTEAGRKAALTRYKKLKTIQPSYDYIVSDEARVDEKVRQSFQKSLQVRHEELISEGKIIKEWIDGIIADFSGAGYGNTGIYLERFLDNEINQFGFNTVMEAIGNVPEEYKAQAQEVIFYASDEENLTRALDAITLLIRGSILELQEKRELYETFDSEVSFEQ